MQYLCIVQLYVVGLICSYMYAIWVKSQLSFDEIVLRKTAKSKIRMIEHHNDKIDNDKICSAHISTLLGAQGANPETPGQAPSLSR